MQAAAERLGQQPIDARYLLHEKTRLHTAPQRVGGLVGIAHRPGHSLVGSKKLFSVAALGLNIIGLAQRAAVVHRRLQQPQIEGQQAVGRANDNAVGAETAPRQVDHQLRRLFGASGQSDGFAEAGATLQQRFGNVR